MGPVGVLDTEMLSMDVTLGGSLAGVRLRESPSRPSVGKHIIRTIDGGYRIGSFFDVFLELSIDGGQNWVAALTPVHVDYAPIEPPNNYNVDTFPPVGTWVNPPTVPSYYANGIIARGFRPSAVRYLLLSAYYRKQLNFTWESLGHAEGALRRLTDCLTRMEAVTAEGAHPAITARVEQARAAFADAMMHDLNTAAALGAMFDLVGDLNSALDAGELGTGDLPVIRQAFDQFDSVLGVLEANYRGTDIRPQLVHRLDKDTSGLLLVAKNSATAKELETRFQHGDVEKEYLCLVKGRLRLHEGHIDFPLPGRQGNPVHALTRYHVSRQFSDATLVRVKIETGRLHQIRLHFAKLGYPVIMDEQHGDFAYNRRFRKQFGLKRQFLHAEKLALQDAGKLKQWTAPLPEDLNEVLNRLSTQEL